MRTADFLVEVGTEELPPKALRLLMEAFAAELTHEIDEARLAHGDVRAYASPRRLAVRIDRLAGAQENRIVEQKGPPLSVAFGGNGKPSPAALAFARKCGVDVAELGRTRSDKGEWLSYEATEPGRATAVLLPDLLEKVLGRLPVPRRMRWGAGDAEFVRPVHWIVLLHGDAVIEADLLGVRSGRATRGHRFHADRTIDVARPSAYLEILESEGRVIADFERRRSLVEDGVAQAAAGVGGQIVNGESLYDEVAALVEWPVPLVGAFDETYLELPREVVVSTLTGHQRYFPVADSSGRLLPRFVTVANLESRDPDRVRDGNERVVRPRLADAAFFWDQDRRTPLAARRGRLAEVVYQQGLGTLADKSARLAELAGRLAQETGIPGRAVRRAAELSKCDLVTGMVGEFPELQGTMGRYYALADGEDAAVGDAIAEHYQPRFAGDRLPTGAEGQILAVADRLDTIAGAFALGKKPSGNRDPFALRRAALGIVRLLIEGRLDVDLKAAIRYAVGAQPVQAPDVDAATTEIYAFIAERLRSYFLDRDGRLATETFDAVLAREPVSLVDFAARLDAVQAFVALEEAESLAAANKRIGNILRKSAADHGEERGKIVDDSLFRDAAETELHRSLASAAAEIGPLLTERDYTQALRRLAALKQPIDSFFDDVLVMADEERVRSNRLALLGDVRALFLRVADISRLALD
jgi:glycyl-tRNA synthetase beta chain